MAKYDHLIVSDLKYEPEMSLDFKAIYERFASRVLWIDSNVVPGAFQMNVSWYKKVPELDPIFEAHAHEDSEILGFFGTDPEDPYNLHGEVQVDIDGEPHAITGSSLIFLPSNIPHALHIKRVDQPIFHFSIMSGAKYNNSAYK